MFGFNYYEDQEFKAKAKASAQAAFEKKKNAPPPEPGYFDKPAPGTKFSWEGGMEYEPLDGNLGYLIGSGVRALEDIGKAGALLLGDYEAAGSEGRIKVRDEDVHLAARTVGDIARTMLPFFIPGIGVATGTTTITASTGIESVKQGMDAETAGVRAALAGTTTLGMAAVVPLSGKALNALFTGQGNAVAEVGKSFALNMGLGQAQRTADWAVVQQNYPELAEQLEVFGPKTVGLDLAMWGLFAGLGYKQVRRQLIDAGVPVTEASRAIRVAEEIIGADSAVEDAVYVRRQAKTLADGPLLSPDAYDVQLAMVDDVMARLDNAEPLPVDVPDNVALKPVESAKDIEATEPFTGDIFRAHLKPQESPQDGDYVSHTIKTLDAMQTANPKRNYTERIIDLLMGEPSGKGEVQPWINKAMGIEHEFMAHLAGGIKEFDGWLGVRMSPEQELLLARELQQPGSTGDSAMKKAADHIRTTFDAMRTRANKAGADIGYIEGYYPQAWNSRQVMLFGQDAMTIAKGFRNQAAAIADAKAKWVDFMLQRVDRNHPDYIDPTNGTRFTDLQMTKFLEKAFETIATNGAAKGMAKQGKGSLAARMASERQLHFKDAESWVEANKLFGQNDLLTSIVAHVQRSSRDIALLEMFGPNPDRVFEEVLQHAVRQDATTQWLFNRKVNFANALWMEVTGTRGTAGTGMVADAAAAARQGLVFSRLGSALLSQLGDLPIFHAMAVKSGMPEFASMLEMARTLNPAKVGDRAVADTFEFGLSALHDDVMSRVMDTTNGKGLSAKLAKFTMQAGGMQWWADRMAHGAKLLLARGLYQMHGKRFEDQSPGNLALLKRSGITADEWNRQILNNQSIVADFNGREVLAPHLIEDAALREKLWGLIERESTFMALRPDEKTRALIKGTYDRGSAAAELAHSMALFRSFTAAMIQKVYPRLTARLPGETRGQWMYKAGTFMVFSMLTAAMSMQSKEISKGRNPRDMDDPRFWAQAFGQAWNLGVIGDMLYGERNRFGQSALATVAGPVAGMLEDLWESTVGNVNKAARGDDIDLAATSVRVVKNYATPNLWYLRPALDQFLWWPLQEMANPGYLQRSQSRIERENGTTFWLPPTGAERY